MIHNIINKVKTHKEEIIAVMALLSIAAVLGYIFRDVIAVLAIIFLFVTLANLDNITTYFQNWMSEKRQQQALVIQQRQTIQDILAEYIFRGLTGHLGKRLGAMPPQNIWDVFPTTIPPIRYFNNVTTYRFTVYRTPGSQPISEDVMKNIFNSYLQRASSSGLLFPKPGTCFQPYFHTLEVTPDATFPDTYNFHVLYVDNALTDEFLNNRMCEDAENWRRQLIDTQPLDDEEF